MFADGGGIGDGSRVVEVSGPFVLAAQRVMVCKLTNPNPGV